MFELQRSKSRIVALLLIVSLGLAACGSDASNPSPDETDSVPTTVTTVSGGEPAENETDIDPSTDGVEDSEKVPSSAPTTLGEAEPSVPTTSEAPAGENEPSTSTTIATATTSAPVTTPDPSSPATTAPTSTFEIETVEPQQDLMSTVSPTA